MTGLPSSVLIRDVSLRDGLQDEELVSAEFGVLDRCHDRADDTRDVHVSP